MDVGVEKHEDEDEDDGSRDGGGDALRAVLPSFRGLRLEKDEKDDDEGLRGPWRKERRRRCDAPQNGVTSVIDRSKVG